MKPGPKSVTSMHEVRYDNIYIYENKLIKINKREEEEEEEEDLDDVITNLSFSLIPLFDNKQS